MIKPAGPDSHSTLPPGPEGSLPRDLISLRDHVIEIEIGAFQQERGLKQRVRFNLVAELARLAPDRSADDVDDILSYDVLIEAIEDALSDRRLDLLETLAEGIAARILRTGRVARVHVRIEKLDRSSGALGVEITRDQSGPDLACAPGSGTPVPRVIFLQQDALIHPDLSSFLDRVAAQGGAVLCVDPGEIGVRAQNDRAQWRIDLLAIEQAAWLLAGRDSRCVVVATRTELDWGVRHRQISVWAPSKLALDARAGPVAGSDARALAAWLAKTLGTPQLETIGTAEISGL